MLSTRRSTSQARSSRRPRSVGGSSAASASASSPVAEADVAGMASADAPSTGRDGAAASGGPRTVVCADARGARPSARASTEVTLAVATAPASVSAAPRRRDGEGRPATPRHGAMMRRMAVAGRGPPTCTSATGAGRRESIRAVDRHRRPNPRRTSRQTKKGRVAAALRNSNGPDRTYMSMPMPPMPPMPPPGAGDSSLGASATIASVVSISEATDAAFCSAVRVTLVGSRMPISIMSP